MSRVPLIFAGTLIAACALVGVALWVSPGEKRVSSRSSPGEWSRSEAEAFEEYPVYWAGPAINGHALTWVYRELVDENPSSRVPTKRDGFLLIYGDCVVGDDMQDACPAPLAIRTTLRCYQPPELFPDDLKRGPPQDIGDSGAVVQVIGGQKQVWTGRLAITIQGDAILQDAALESLQLINGDKFPADEALRAPVDEPCDEIQGRPRENVLPSE